MTENNNILFLDLPERARPWLQFMHIVPPFKGVTVVVAMVVIVLVLVVVLVVIVSVVVVEVVEVVVVVVVL